MDNRDVQEHTINTLLKHALDLYLQRIIMENHPAFFSLKAGTAILMCKNDIRYLLESCNIGLIP